MVAKPDAGSMVAQRAVPILPDDTAFDVFQKVTVAAEVLLDTTLPNILAGTATLTPLDLTKGSYFGGRKPEDGRIDWTQGAMPVHNLIRGVAPPYPGAFADVRGKRLRFLRSRITTTTASSAAPALYVDGTQILFSGSDLRVVEMLAVECDDAPIDAAAFARLFGTARVALPEATSSPRPS
jgi:methionyl-tRNA formyltransferase